MKERQNLVPQVLLEATPLQIRIGDGRHELLRSEERWDLITLEPPPSSAAGVVNIYSSNFYALCRRRLEALL
jgi:spermidine synthase